jgi:hypothetical protein
MLGEAVRLFFLLYQRHLALQRASVFFKEFVYYYQRVSRQLALMVAGPRPICRLRVAVHVLTASRYLWRRCLDRARAKVSLESQERIATLLARVQSPRLRGMLCSLMTCSESKNNLAYINAVREVSHEVKSMNQEHEFMVALFSKYVEEGCFAEPKPASRFALSADLTLRITRSLNQLGELAGRTRILSRAIDNQ